MYTLLELESKTFAALKQIGDELNVLPEGDRRYRQSWIDAIAGVNPPLLQLLEVFPPASVEPAQERPIESKFGRIVYPRPDQKSIVPVAENSPGVEVEPTQEPPIEKVSTLFQVGDLVESVHHRWGLEKASLVGTVTHVFPLGRVRVNFGAGGHFDFSNPGENLIKTSMQEAQAQEPIVPVAENSPAVEADRVSEASVPVAENSPAVEVDRVEDFLPECSTCFGDGYIEDEFGFVKFCPCETEPKLSCQKTQSAIAPAAKNLPGSRSKTSTAHQLLELFKSSEHIIEDAPGVKTEPKVSQSAIAPAAKNHIEEGSDQNPILTGIPLSDRFVTRYTPPQPEIIHFQSDAYGQLSLLDFEVESVEEPPDPDDFESLDAFRKAITRWDSEHPTSSSDHCSDQWPSSEDNDVSSEDKPLELSLDSFCLWAHCSADCYDPAVLLEPSRVLELSSVQKTSSTSDFFIPTFGRWGDRSNRSDEPPDTGIFALWPKPKLPKFPPQAASQPPVNQVSRSYPETIPKLFHRVVAGRSTQPARSPPGGDAMP